jgi:hypothetical protein
MNDNGGTYRALPKIEQDILEFILQDEAGAVSQFGGTLGDIGSALARVDAELSGLEQANPSLAAAVRGTVEGLYSVFANELYSEQSRAMLRAVSFFNAFTVLRLLDLQWRRMQPS